MLFGEERPWKKKKLPCLDQEESNKEKSGFMSGAQQKSELKKMLKGKYLVPGKVENLIVLYFV